MGNHFEVPLETCIKQIRVVNEVRLDVLLENVERFGVIVNPGAHWAHFLQRIGSPFLIKKINQLGDWNRWR